MMNHTATHKNWIQRYLFSVDHKIIAIQYLVTGIFFLGFGGILAFMIRWQLAYPWKPIPFLGDLFFKASGGILMPEQYPMLFTMHGGIMVFFAVTPILLGALANYIVPLEVGAHDMAFPRLNMLSYWMLFIGSVIVIASFFVPGGAAGTGWTVYAPLSSSTRATAGWGADMFILGLAFDSIAILMGGINIIATTLKLRARGMGLLQMPLTVWGLIYSSILNTLWLPLAIAALIMVLCDRRLGTAFFTAGPLAPHDGGQPLLYQHLFWGFGHPEVYILILPVWGLVADLISTFSRKPAFGYKSTVFSMATITFLSGIVWGHHMFTSGMNPLVGRAFTILTISISVPTAIFFLNWLATLYKGSIRLTLPMLYTLGVVFVFTIGGLTGLFHALQAFDVYIHDTYFVVGHFHFTLAASVLFGAFAFIYYWYPKMFGRMMNPQLGTIHFWLSFILINVLFTTMMVVGLHGHMRRIADPSAYDFLKPVKSLNLMMGWVALSLVFTQLLFFVNFIGSLFFGKKASSNPWESATLAWQTSSPPPEHNFDENIIVYGGPHEYGHQNPKGRDFYAQNEIRLSTRMPSPKIAEEHFAWFPLYKVGMWSFLVSEIMLFTGFIGSYLVLRLGSTNWPHPGSVLNINLLGFNTFVLITSSLTMVLAADAAQRGESQKARPFLLATAFLGIVFLSLKAWDYHHMWTEGFTISTSLFGSCYYLLTGFHALHVLSGIILILYLWVAAGRKNFAPLAGRVEAGGLYWHFIDIIWVILFAALCLL